MVALALIASCAADRNQSPPSGTDLAARQHISSDIKVVTPVLDMAAIVAQENERAVGSEKFATRGRAELGLNNEKAAHLEPTQIALP